MPKRYTPAQKQEALRLLDLYDYKLSAVQQLTGISHTTLARWRDEHFTNNPDLSFKKSFPIPNERTHITDPPPHPDHPEAELIQDGDFQYYRLPDGRVFADLSQEEREELKHLRDPADLDSPPADSRPPDQPEAGVPGRTYPYLLEDEETDAEKNLEEFRKVREILMSHAHQLAASLAPEDPDINRRSLALARILDRIHQLDAMLPELMPEQIIRFEFVYDGMVHNTPPWEQTEEEILEELKRLRDRKAREASRETSHSPHTSHA